ERYIRSESKDAFDRTFRVLRTRIDQFGVAQPTINPNSDKAIISVELPGIQDKDRVRKYLQSTANLQFWEVYTLADPNYGNGWQKMIEAFAVKMGGKAPATDSTVIKDSLALKDSLAKKQVVSNTAVPKPKETLNKKDTSKNLSSILNSD